MDVNFIILIKIRENFRFGDNRVTLITQFRVKGNVSHCRCLSNRLPYILTYPVYTPPVSVPTCVRSDASTGGRAAKQMVEVARRDI